MAYRRIPSLNWLRVFDAAARTESFSSAADILNMSPSAVSQQISALEDHLGQKLFEREARRVRLSEAGALYLPVVHDALASIEESTGKIFGAREADRIVLHANTVFANGWLAPRLPRFYADNPTTTIDIHCIEISANSRLPDADISILFGPTRWREGERSILYTEKIYPVASRTVAKRIKTPEDLVQFRLVEVYGHRQSWRLVLNRLGVPEPIDPTVCVVSNSQLAMALVESDEAVGLARAPTTDPIVAQHGLVPCIDGFQIGGEGSYVLTTKPTDRPRSAVTRFREWVIAEAAESTL